jgi:hypothetical protein
MNHQSNQLLFSSTFYLPCSTSRLLYKLALSILFNSLPISTSLCLTPFYPPFYPSHFTASTFSQIYIEQLIGFEKEAYIKDNYKQINDVNASNKRVKTEILHKKTESPSKLVYKLNKALYSLKQSPRL